MFKETDEKGNVKIYTGGPVIPGSDKTPLGLAALLCQELGRTPTIDEIQQRWDEIHKIVRNPDGSPKQMSPKMKSLLQSVGALPEQKQQSKTVDLMALKRLYRKAFLRYATKQIDNLTDEEEEDIAHLVDDVNVVSFKTWLMTRGYVNETGS